MLYNEKFGRGSVTPEGDYQLAQQFDPKKAAQDFIEYSLKMDHIPTKKEVEGVINDMNKLNESILSGSKQKKISDLKQGSAGLKEDQKETDLNKKFWDRFWNIYEGTLKQKIN